MLIYFQGIILKMFFFIALLSGCKTRCYYSLLLSGIVMISIKITLIIKVIAFVILILIHYIIIYYDKAKK